MFSLEKRGKKKVRVKVFLTGGFREVIVIKDEEGSVDSFKRESQEWCLVICVKIQRGRGARFEVEVEVDVSGSIEIEWFVTSTEGTTGRVREVKREEARKGNEERVIAVDEVIVLDEEGSRGVGDE